MSDSSKPDAKLLDILVCPLTRGTLDYDSENDELISKAANLAYPVRAGIPVMVASEARELDAEEKKAKK